MNIYKLAEDYSNTCSPHSRQSAYCAYIEGYNQAVAEEVTLDEWQQRLSDEYSNLKVKYFEVKRTKGIISHVLGRLIKGEITPDEAKGEIFGLKYAKRVKKKLVTDNRFYE